MYGKPLAYVVRVGEIREIPGADRIELASVMDYTVVVKKENTSLVTLASMSKSTACCPMVSATN